jgi:hypothetical protein
LDKITFALNFFFGEKYLLKRTFTLIILALAFLPFNVQAQSEITLSRLEVDLWPEYDRPSMLVIYHIALSPDLSMPAELTFRIPAAGEVNAVAIRQVDGTLFDANYQKQFSGEWALITFTATTPEVQLEYYDPSLTIQGDQRHFEYHWPGDYAVTSFNVQVQQPIGATNLTISPTLGTGTQAQDGLTYYTSQIGSLEAGNTFTISLDYQKSGNALSANSLSVQPSGPLPSSTSGNLFSREILPWILGGFGLLLIAGAGFWYWRSGREQVPTLSRRRRRVLKNNMDHAASDEQAIYCHQCGKRAAPGDLFCRSCGTRLRV